MGRKQLNKIRTQGFKVDKSTLLDFEKYCEKKFLKPSQLVEKSLLEFMSEDISFMAKRLGIKLVSLDMTDYLIARLNKCEITDRLTVLTVDTNICYFHMSVEPYFVDTPEEYSVGIRYMLDSVTITNDEIDSFIEDCEMTYDIDRIIDYLID